MVKTGKDGSIQNFKGTFTALITPFDERGGVDLPAFRKLLRYQVESGVSGLVIGGTTGESATLERIELLELVETARNEVGDRMWVVAGCGSNNTAKAVELSRKVKECGATAGLSVVPYYNKPSQEGLYRHFMTIASEAGLPIILYNVPGRTGANLAADTVSRLAEHPMIVGIKEASGNLRQVEEILLRSPPDFHLLSGDDGLTYAIIALGGCGVVSVASNLLPAQVSKMVNAMLLSRWEEAMEIHRRLTPLNDALFIDTNPVPVKEAFGILGFDVGNPRLPLYPLDTAKREALTAILKNYEKDFRGGMLAPLPEGGE